MKALSLWQPWAWLVAAGIKGVENRTWNTKFRGRFYIHASRSPNPTLPGFSDKWIIRRLTGVEEVRYLNARIDRGAIIGEATLVDCRFRYGEENEELYSKWHEVGMYGFYLKDAKIYAEPIPCRGALGFFEPYEMRHKGVIK